MDASSMQCSHALGFQRSDFSLPSRQTPFEQRQQGCRATLIEQDILVATTFYGINTTIQSRTIRFVHKSTREVSVGGRWDIRVLMEQTLSLHYVAEIPLSLRYTSLKSSILLLRYAPGLFH